MREVDLLLGDSFLLARACEARKGLLAYRLSGHVVGPRRLHALAAALGAQCLPCTDLAPGTTVGLFLTVDDRESLQGPRTDQRQRSQIGRTKRQHPLVLEQYRPALGQALRATRSVGHGKSAHSVAGGTIQPAESFNLSQRMRDCEVQMRVAEGDKIPCFAQILPE